MEFMASRMIVEAYRNYQHYCTEKENDVKRKVLKAKVAEKAANAKERISNISSQSKTNNDISRNGRSTSRGLPSSRFFKSISEIDTIVS